MAPFSRRFVPSCECLEERQVLSARNAVLFEAPTKHDIPAQAQSKDAPPGQLVAVQQRVLDAKAIETPVITDPSRPTIVVVDQPTEPALDNVRSVVSSIRTATAPLVDEIRDTLTIPAVGISLAIDLPQAKLDVVSKEGARTQTPRVNDRQDALHAVAVADFRPVEPGDADEADAVERQAEVTPAAHPMLYIRTGAERGISAPLTDEAAYDEPATDALALPIGTNLDGLRRAVEELLAPLNALATQAGQSLAEHQLEAWCVTLGAGIASAEVARRLVQRQRRRAAILDAAHAEGLGWSPGLLNSTLSFS